MTVYRYRLKFPTFPRVPTRVGDPAGSRAGRNGRVKEFGGDFTGRSGWLLFVLAWWGLTAWLGRREVPWAIRLTTPIFVAALAWTYFATWGIAVTFARDRRRMRSHGRDHAVGRIRGAVARGAGCLRSPRLQSRRLRTTRNCFSGHSSLAASIATF